ncbi:hypothetical protein [carnivorous sponge associated iridovirus]|jgi:hypothetical protein|nr:hypothetical protein [carnivorous sponge associated iridovirus]
MYLTRLATDEIDIGDERSLAEYSTFLASHINSMDRLIEVIRNLKCKLKTDNLEGFFEPLRPYIETYKPKQSVILKTSHAFCDCCELYVPSHLCVWVRNNSELFETEIAFYDRLLRHFGSLIKADVSPYPVDELYIGEDTPLSGQTNREKLKLLSSVVRHYEYICKYLM